MAPKPKPWFRFYTEALSDRKLRRLRPEHRWLWVAVLGTARMSRTPGALYVGELDPMSAEDLADIAALPVKDVRSGMAAFVESGMLNVDPQGAWVVARWNDRQFESDLSTERTQKHRSKERSIDVPGTVIEQPKEQPQKTETEADTETEKTPLPLVLAEPPSKDPKPVAYAPEFEEFWRIYPRRESKPNAAKAFTKALKTTRLDDVLDGARRWAAHWTDADTEKAYIPHPATWLNDHRFNDEPPPLRRPATRVDRNRDTAHRVAAAITESPLRALGIGGA